MGEDKVAQNGNGADPAMAASSHPSSHPKLKRSAQTDANRPPRLLQRAVVLQVTSLSVTLALKRVR